MGTSRRAAKLQDADRTACRRREAPVMRSNGIEMTLANGVMTQ
ncbi:MAG TPA: hypothetical protein VFB93_03975 [Burkholderiales bacterium]|nr:hypothetical protein [Burkholderiales bacterium]